MSAIPVSPIDLSVVSYHELIGEGECAAVRDTVHALRSWWICRDGGLGGFFTLGRNAYQDVAASSDPDRDYYARVRESNALLIAHFGALLERVRSRFADLLGEPAELATDLALPGFHIFLRSALSTRGAGSLHMDQQQHALRWPAPCYDVPPVSFTLAIALPAAGGGLDVWEPHACADVADLAAHGPTAYYPYERGTLVVHDGLTLHSIAPPARLADDDERITLQGHARRLGGRWILYW